MTERKSAAAPSQIRAKKPGVGALPLSSAFTTLSLQGTQLVVETDETKQADAALLDGCSVLETDVARETMAASTVDARYRDLQRVERDFRTMKTGVLELRPAFVRKESPAQRRPKAARV